MEAQLVGKGKLIVPTDFTAPAASRKIQQDLKPPSHFTSSRQSVGVPRGLQIPRTSPPIAWISSGLTPAAQGDPTPAPPWFSVTQVQQEILELQRQNQRIMMSQGDLRGRNAIDFSADFRTRSADRSGQCSKWETEWRLEVAELKAEAARLKGQVEALKETAERHREEMRDRDSTLIRQSHGMEATREELCKAKTELGQVSKELKHTSAQKEETISQLERLKRESGEDIGRLKKEAERSKEENEELALKAEAARLQTEEEAKQLSKQLEQLHMEQEIKLRQMNAKNHTELAKAQQMNSELQDRLHSVTSEVVQLKSSVMEISAERDGLKAHLSQMGQDFETQSSTLHSLRNYIGQLAPDKGESKRLSETIERLNKEKVALQMTTELLTVRLNSVTEILSLQEEKLLKETAADPLVKDGSAVLQVLQLWREKVFKLCVQLRSKDIELRGEKEKRLSTLRSMEQQLQQEQHNVSLLQHSLDDKIAELDLERVEKETLKGDLSQAHMENVQLKSERQQAEAGLRTVTEAVQRFSLGFEGKVLEVEAAQTRLNSFTQRLCFAKRRLETVQGLMMRRVALQKVQQASKQAEQAADSVRDLQSELSLVCEERDKLAQELKITPELIQKALADLREQYESKLRQQQQELERSWVEVRQAVAGREEAQRSLQESQAQLKESKVNLDKLGTELLRQQEQSEQGLKERGSEIENRCAERLREMEAQVNAARREQTKAVMTLRQFERLATRKQDPMRDAGHLQSEHTKRPAQNKQPKEADEDKNILPASVSERGMRSESQRAMALQNSASLWEQIPAERSCGTGGNAQLSTNESLLSVLEVLQTLSAAVVNSSEEEEEEEGLQDVV
ncbi:coiled-coil alpha-helical rod protein 1 [Genypterus blacodes]|uniref:coiled-coil alpha-helical rod protein 1 n=1 Tax=Genypterus blacodes TaxID=154954 RepID=UPI003F76816A